MNPSRSGRIVFWGVALSLVSFFIGLTHLFLPAVLIHLFLAVAGILLMSIVCVVSVAMYAFGIAMLTIFTAIAHPVCIILLMPMLFFAKRKFARR